MKGQNPSHITATASNTKLSEAELQEQGLRILARMIARCHVEKNSDSEVENGSKSDHEGSDRGEKAKWTRRTGCSLTT